MQRQLLLTSAVLPDLTWHCVKTSQKSWQFDPVFQEYMTYRKHKYMRLDGSSKISDRRDMVADFQSK